MHTENDTKEVHYQSRLSFKPLLDVLKKTLHHGSSEGSKKLYSGILTYADACPELTEPIDDLAKLDAHSEWLEMLLSIIFPPTTSEHESLYCVSLPFSYTNIYTSRLFHMLFIKPGTMEIKVPDNETGNNIQHDMLMGAYHLILKKYCHDHADYFVSSVHPIMIRIQA